ncbi:hypothetical protein GCM10010988_22800 [Cnuibacter physcomitrellae]|uniref:Uncharacterized protein n=1 Tax=Cnuibacter physcomitrellae TaxID=1619308 RepID=A0A1X9LR73_9MICO|nr:hypothetical protein [Cnuibacter physcomitrellae]ARJ06942.1 hypothetical protein B5808_18200 [Cnuibacter physcomitrellae]GGI39184.1 hypothetical protein GCM10010988_22800 [Cnuibacter physcomitrellae]
MPSRSLRRLLVLPMIASAVVMSTALAPAASATTHGFVGEPEALGTFSHVDDVAVDAVTGRLWFQADGALTVVDGTDLRILTRVASGWDLLAMDPLSRFAVARDGDDLVRISLDRMTETARATLPIGEVDIDPLHHRLVGIQHDTTDDCIVVVDEATLAITARQCFTEVAHVEFDVHADAVIATVLTGGRRVLATFDSATVLNRVDLVSTTPDLPFGSVIQTWHVDRSTRTLVMEITDPTSASSTYVVYDLRRREAVTAFPLRGAIAAPFLIGADSTIIQLTGSSVSVIDTRTGAERQVLPLARRPRGAVIDASSGDLYLLYAFTPSALRVAWS